MKTTKIALPKNSLLEKTNYSHSDFEANDEGSSFFETTSITTKYVVIEFDSPEELEADIKDRIENPRADYDYCTTVVLINYDGRQQDIEEFFRRMEFDLVTSKEAKKVVE